MIFPLLLVIVCLSCSSVAPVGGFSCPAETEKCASEWIDMIKGKVDQFLFRASCRDYKLGLNCLAQLPKKNNQCTITNYPTEFEKAKRDLYDTSKGLCGADGSIVGCAYSFVTCMAFAQKIRNPRSNTTCTDFIEMSDCVQLISDQLLCAPFIEERLKDTLDTLRVELQTECFRTCDMVLDLCIKDVPPHLTLDEKITEEEQEVLCAELETATACLNDVEVEGLCGKEQKTSQWENVIQNQRSSHEEFCSVPAKTCVVELQNCFIDLNALKEEGVPSPEDLIEICQEAERTIECIDRTSKSEYCQGKSGAELMAAALNHHKDDMGAYCGVGQCQKVFSSCFDLIATVRHLVIEAPNTLECKDVTLSLSCLRSMEQLKACHSLEFENVTVDRAMVVLNEFIPALCDYQEEKKMTECETIFPECFASVVYAEAKPNSCSAAKERHRCTKMLTVSMSCKDSLNYKKFTDVRRSDAAYMLENGCKDPVSDDDTDEEKPDKATMLHMSTVLLLTSLRIAAIFNHY